MEIKIKDVCFGNILENINLNIHSNSITVIMGKSGSGKTTLLEIIDLLLFPYSGYVEYDTNIINKDDVSKVGSYRNKVGLVFQFPEEQFFCSNVEKEIQFGLNYLNKDSDKIKKRVADSLKMVGLDNTYLKRELSTLSTGEKRKVSIASILAFNPEVIIFDEPTIGLDIKSKKSLMKIIRMLKNRYNKTIIISTKDSELAHSIADEVFIIGNGKIVLKGNKYDVFTNNVEDYGILKPKIIQFEQLALKNKNVKMLYRDDINDLMKDVYRSVK